MRPVLNREVQDVHRLWSAPRQARLGNGWVHPATGAMPEATIPRTQQGHDQFCGSEADLPKPRLPSKWPLRCGAEVQKLALNREAREPSCI